jgi:hypothetical protein
MKYSVCEIANTFKNMSMPYDNKTIKVTYEIITK